jgi:hypothetical protein
MFSMEVMTAELFFTRWWISRISASFSAGFRAASVPRAVMASISSKVVREGPESLSGGAFHLDTAHAAEFDRALCA